MAHPKDLYDEGILTWSQRQAQHVRRRSANALDWGNLAEEIEDTVRSQLRSAESRLVQAVLYELKVAAWPESRDVPHWKAEARGRRDDARAALTPSVAQRIDLAAVYRRALRRLPESSDGQPPLPLPDGCPTTLDALLAEDA
jgi:hypothetical protein